MLTQISPEGMRIRSARSSPATVYILIDFIAENRALPRHSQQFARVSEEPAGANRQMTSG